MEKRQQPHPTTQIPEELEDLFDQMISKYEKDEHYIIKIAQMEYANLLDKLEELGKEIVSKLPDGDSDKKLMLQGIDRMVKFYDPRKDWGDC